MSQSLSPSGFETINPLILRKWLLIKNRINQLGNEQHKPQRFYRLIRGIKATKRGCSQTQKL